MSQASRRTGPGARDRSERWQPRTAAVLTALLHLLLVLLVLLAPPITMTPPPPGGDAGGSMAVTFIDESLRPPPPAHRPTVRPAPARKPAKTAPATRRIRTTPVAQARDPVPPDAADSPTTSPATEPEPPSEPPPAPPDAVARPERTWGQPPGMLPDAIAPANAGHARSPAANPGRSNAASSGASMEVEGYQVYYELIRDARLRAWRDQGMTELFLPLPGTRRLMVCPLEIVLRRGDGACRMVEPDAPELNAIGDAREVINMQKVYKLGEELWSGPGAYR